MPEYTFQYRREQRYNFEIIADTQEEADKEANKLIQTLKLSSEDDESDDPGELEELECVAAS